MKLLFKAPPILKDLPYTVGQKIVIATDYDDGRNCWETIRIAYTVMKVNKVTIDIKNADGDIYRFNPNTDKGTILTA